MENLIKELKAAFEKLNEATKELAELKKEQATQAQELFELKRQLKEVAVLPEWIPTAKALEILQIKKPHTLKSYATMGLIEVKRGYDKRNYYRRDDVMKIPEKLFELQNQEV